MIEDLEVEFKEIFGIEKWDEFNIILDKVIDNNFEDLKENGFDISCYKEKVHQLQENIHIDICFNHNEIQLMYENGINNGTQLNDYSFNSNINLSDIDRHYNIVTDVVVDYEKMDLLGINYSKIKAEILLDNNKQKLLQLAKDENYDNYVTGGGTNKTNKYYKNEREKLNNKGLYYKYVTKTVTVKANFH